MQEATSTPAPKTKADIEQRKQLLRELDDILHKLEAIPPVPNQEENKLQEAVFSARIARMRAGHAPWIHLGSTRLRWLARLLNAPIWLWGRKQDAFNREVILALEDEHRRVKETLESTATLPKLEARLARLEAEWRLTEEASTSKDS